MKRKFLSMFASRSVISFFFVFSSVLPLGFAVDQKQDSAKKMSTQNIGGLLFDVDEGVKVERGPGGSVYMKSNKEYMQEKFSQIEQKFTDLEARIVKLEVAQVASESSAAAPPEGSAAADNENRRVLIT